MVLQPEPLLAIRHVRELRADGIAEYEVKRREYVLELHARRDSRRAAAGDELGLHIGRRQAEERGVREWRASLAAARSRGSKWAIKLTAIAIDLNEPRHRGLLRARRAAIGRRRPAVEALAAGPLGAPARGGLARPRRDALRRRAPRLLGRGPGLPARKVARPPRSRSTWGR